MWPTRLTCWPSDVSCHINRHIGGVSVDSGCPIIFWPTCQSIGYWHSADTSLILANLVDYNLCHGCNLTRVSNVCGTACADIPVLLPISQRLLCINCCTSLMSFTGFYRIRILCLLKNDILTTFVMVSRGKKNHMDLTKLWWWRQREKVIGLMSKTTTLHMHHTFLNFLCK